jgi:hypothetical protein
MGQGREGNGRDGELTAARTSYATHLATAIATRLDRASGSTVCTRRLRFRVTVDVFKFASSSFKPVALRSIAPFREAS